MSKPVNPICGRLGCRARVPHEHIKFGEVGSSGSLYPPIKAGQTYDFMSPRAKEALAAEKRGISEDVISKALLKLGASSDPEADRFEGKSSVEIQVTLLGERVAKYADQTDKALATLSVTTRKTEETIEACWEHWKKDQQRPALQQEFAERMNPLVSNTAKIVMDSITFRQEIRLDIGVYKKAVESLLTRRQLSVWGVVLGTVIGIYASLAGALLVIAVAVHTQQFWNWIAGGSSL